MQSESPVYQYNWCSVIY